MALTLYMHPLSSYCMKALIALYENETPFEAKVVDLGSEPSRGDFLRLWPIGKFPLLEDGGNLYPESTIVIEHLAQRYPGRTELIPKDPSLALAARLGDRFYDNYVHDPMQKIVGDKIRPKGKEDPFGVAEARARLDTSYGIIEKDMASRTWAIGEVFTLADCAAGPALYYANLVHPLGKERAHASAYLERLMRRPSFARALDEAKPYFHMFPG